MNTWLKPDCKQTIFYRGLANGCIIVCLLAMAGCSSVGPASVRSGRLAYNKAITETNNQQMLLFVIQNRYEEFGSLLAVASVTANVRVSSKAGVQVGFGDMDNYAGRLVPFNAGVVYEENPTISYTPVTGAEYAHQLFSPVSIATLAQLTGTINDPAYVYTGLLSSINTIQNPDFQGLRTDRDQQFSRLVTILKELTQAQRLRWIENPQQPGSFSIVIDRYAPDYSSEVSELLTLLGVPAAAGSQERVVLPVFLALDGSESGGVGVITRSVADLIEILSAAVDIPEEELQSGVAAIYPQPGYAGRELRIHRSETKPENGSVAVQHRGTWFYIDETDLATKRFFRLLSALWSIRMAESASKGAAAPVLTVPVSR